MSGATFYNVYRFTISGTQPTTPYRTGITATTFVDTSLTAEATYYYQFTSVQGHTESPRFAEVSAVGSHAIEVQPAQWSAN